jgi:plastocyanin
MTDGPKYVPKRIELPAGTTVTWENVGSVGHTVTACGDGIPDGATSFPSGGSDSLRAAKDGYTEERAGNSEAAGTYEHSFETTGTHKPLSPRDGRDGRLRQGRLSRVMSRR